MSRIGVFICHCGENISATVDVVKVAEEAGKHEGVAYSTDYKYMCSEPGQTIIKQMIKEKGLTGWLWQHVHRECTNQLSVKHAPKPV